MQGWTVDSESEGWVGERVVVVAAGESEKVVSGPRVPHARHLSLLTTTTTTTTTTFTSLSLHPSLPLPIF